MPSKPKSHKERFPDYGVSRNDVRYGSNGEKIFYYAAFNKGSFTYEDHMAIRVKPIRKDMWKEAANRLVLLGFLSSNVNKYEITPLGTQAISWLGALNASRPDRNNISA